MRVSVVQMSASTDKAENMGQVEQRVSAAERAGHADLVVLPEAVMHDFGRTDQPLAPAAEPLDGPFVALLQRLAAEHGTTVVAGMFEQTDDPQRAYNTLVAVDGSGLRASYRKVHLYDSFGYRESDRLVAGDPQSAVLEVADLRLGLMTCYDLRFPELSRFLVDAGADTLVIPAAWVAGPRKVDHWRTLLRARAIENTCHVVAAAQCGRAYSGHSAVIDPMGEVLVELDNEPGSGGATITREGLDEARASNPALLHRRLTVTVGEQAVGSR